MMDINNESVQKAIEWFGTLSYDDRIWASIMVGRSIPRKGQAVAITYDELVDLHKNQSWKFTLGR